MKVAIDPALCKSQARCYQSFPHLFERGQDGKGVVRAAAHTQDDDLHFDLQSAANQCPRGAIVLEED